MPAAAISTTIIGTPYFSALVLISDILFLSLKAFIKESLFVTSTPLSLRDCIMSAEVDKFNPATDKPPIAPNPAPGNAPTPPAKAPMPAPADVANGTVLLADS